MRCDEVRLQLPDHVLGTLSETEAAAVRRHLRGCASCRQDATELDQGVALFAGAAHVAEPPPDLKDRVLAVLEEEWTDAASPARRRRAFRPAWLAMAAILILLAGVVAWAGVAQGNANRFREDALSYRDFLGALGGKDVRAGTLEASAGVTLEGSVVMYDSHRGGQSWVLVLARAPGSSDEVTVTVVGQGGRTIRIPFALKFGPDGEGWTGLFTGADLTKFDRVVLTLSDGRVIAKGQVPPSD